MRAALAAHARAWVAAVAGAHGRLLQAGEPLAAAVRAAFDRDGGPLLVAASTAPRLGVRHARMALDDLAAGIDLALGPGMDGGWYLAALARPEPGLVDLLGRAGAGHDVTGEVLRIATAGDLRVGLLRMERVLRTPEDVRALVVDPLTPDRIRMALSRLG